MGMVFIRRSGRNWKMFEICNVRTSRFEASMEDSGLGKRPRMVEYR